MSSERPVEGRGEGQLDPPHSLAVKGGGGGQDQGRAAGLRKGEVRGGSEISDLATVSSWGVISWPTSSHVLEDHLGPTEEASSSDGGSNLGGAGSCPGLLLPLGGGVGHEM